MKQAIDARDSRENMAPGAGRGSELPFAEATGTALGDLRIACRESRYDIGRCPHRVPRPGNDIRPARHPLSVTPGRHAVGSAGSGDDPGTRRPASESRFDAALEGRRGGGEATPGPREAMRWSPNVVPGVPTRDADVAACRVGIAESGRGEAAPTVPEAPWRDVRELHRDAGARAGCWNRREGRRMAPSENLPVGQA